MFFFCSVLFFNEGNSIKKEMTEEQKHVGKVQNPFCIWNKSQNVTCISL